MLASAVIYTHAVESMGHIDETSLIFGRQIAWLAVNGFFSLSGFLMYRSLERNPSISAFALSRFMRIWPGMFVMCLVAAVIYSFFTVAPLRQYFFGRETLSFIFINQLLVPKYFLTGVYCPENGDTGMALCSINGALWTIRWEISCYAAIATLSAVGFLRRRRFNLVILPTLIVSALVFNYPPVHHWLEARSWTHIYFPEQIVRLWTAFAIGAAAYANRDRIKLSWAGALVGLVLVYLTRSYFFADVVRAFAVCYWILCIAFLSVRSLPFGPRIPDYSFGVYIYHMPVMQVFRICIPHVEPHLLALMSLVAVVPFAALSWYLVEKPAQELRRQIRLPQFRRRLPG
ncbi:hypothetical protein TS85_10540 [Sphingomonas hengshuiensis]|uniref:Acyltransferase 3 domain-containing protein n=2 Tax=Sphingomonas hengshuiensis TaxID=1609977 RepID=A0A7U4J8G6_9SPHN|nr:hypothetical protein TS85_10540 [Sphingomonas hengshuiensis]